MSNPILHGELFRNHVKNTYRILITVLLIIMMLLMLGSLALGAKTLMIVWAIPSLLLALYFLFRLPKYERQYHIEKDAVLITNKRGKIVRILPFCEIKAMNLVEIGVYHLAYGQYIVLLSPKAKKRITPWLRGERWLFRRDMLCLPYTKSLAAHLSQKTGVVMKIPE